MRVVTGRGIAGERHPGRRGVAHVAEHHRLDVDRGAPIARNVVESAIDLGALRMPRSEHRGRRPPELIVDVRSEEHTSELQSLMRNSYAVFCLKKKKNIR